MTNFQIGDKVLLTTFAHFFAPDGKQYRGVFGTVKGVHSSEDTLGIKTNNKSTNWYIEIGNMIIAGCQVNYAIKTKECNFERVDEFSWGENIYHEFTRPTLIYNADQEDN